MTAEIAILNRHAIALAADSAVTIGQQRTWKTANKLFSLSPTNDIGIMIYGAGEFNGHSWEIIAKTFREHIENRVFDTVSECGTEFQKYLGLEKFNNPDVCSIHIYALIRDMVERISQEIGEQQSEDDYNIKLHEVICKHRTSIEDNCGRLEGSVDQSQFEEDYSELISPLVEDIFKYQLTEELESHLIDFLYLAFDSKVDSSFSTGVVVAGFGKKQLFPELIDYRVDGACRGMVRMWINQKKECNGSSAMVVPFAQSDMFQLFMEGITTNHLTFIGNTLRRVLNDNSSRLIDRLVDDEVARSGENALQQQEIQEILSRFVTEFSSYVQEAMVEPVVSVVSTLPKEEMAAMAEALVEITTLRRKVDSTVETVGGPTDVAIISKGDGFIWIKRKYYFDISLNPEFSERKRSRHGGGDATQGKE